MYKISILLIICLSFIAAGVSAQKAEDLTPRQILKNRVVAITIEKNVMELGDTARIYAQTRMLVYDTMGLLEVELIFIDSNSIDSIIYSYDNYGTISSKRFRIKGGMYGDEMDVTTYVNEYDDAALIISTGVTHYTDKITERHRIYYLYGMGKLEELSFEFEDRSKNHRITYEYNFRHLIMRELEIQSSGNVITKEFAYTKEGRMSRMQILEGNKVVWSETFSYNNNSLPVSRIMINEDHTMTTSETYTYDYW